jgi:hypothetical protein
MAKHLVGLDEVLAMMKAADISPAKVAAFKRQAEAVFAHRDTKGYDDVFVTSGFGTHTRKGFVELTINEQRMQMEVKKAQEIGIMLIECATAAAGDEAFVRFMLDKVGIEDDPEKIGRMLLDLREQRQGTRDGSRPS